ncbi:MAG: 4Fe-4S binding protein [Thermoguttaceae bacterium]
MSKRGRASATTLLRRLTQTLFLLLFLGLLVAASLRTGEAARPLLKLFFLLDPLLLLATWLSAHGVPVAMLWSLALVVLTLLLGRVFCGWACPLGTLHALAGWVFHRKGQPRDHWSPWQRAKYYLLAGVLAMAVCGGHWGTIFDPLVLLYRTTTTALLPGVQWAVEDGSTAIFQSDPGVGEGKNRWHLTTITEPVYHVFRDHVFAVPHQAFLGGGAILALFLVTLGLNWYRPRFWCRYLCPLGALLGLLSWRPLLRRAVAPATCNQCDLCGMACAGAAADAGGQGWKATECFGCFTCRDSCTRESLAFRWAWPWRRQPAVARIDLSKRAMLASAVGGLAALALLRITPQARGTTFHRFLIRPPGARPEREFLQRCTACGLCMKMCPTGGLQPAWSEAGLEGLWTPRLVPRIGYCDYACNLCSQVCPTEAIVPKSIAEKQKVHIGLAAFDTNRCIPYAYGRDCMVCQEHCPIPTKAIYFLEVEVVDRNGQKRTIKQPRVDANLCTGCGICENVCPFKDGPAVRVFSANESRNPANQPILSGDDASPY